MYIRPKYPSRSLVDLYDPSVHRWILVIVHFTTDKDTNLCYRSQAFESEQTGIEYLFKLYKAYAIPIFQAKEK